MDLLTAEFQKEMVQCLVVLFIASVKLSILHMIFTLFY